MHAGDQVTWKLTLKNPGNTPVTDIEVTDLLGDFLTLIDAIPSADTNVATNVAGLSLGLAFCLLIYLFIRDELSFDRFHDRADSIYSIVVHDHFTIGLTGKLRFPCAGLKDRFQQVLVAVSFQLGSNHKVYFPFGLGTL
jgi:uncharacterized repeat protein (TIGR01451 family)